MVRVPRVSRLEYIIDYLSALEEGLGRSQTEQRLAQRKMSFESEKYRALGKGAPFSERQKNKLMKAAFILDEVTMLCRTLQLLDKKGSSVSESGRSLILLQPARQKVFFGRLLFKSYPIFGDFLLALKNSLTEELSLPDVRHNRRHQQFREMAKTYGLNIEILTFVTIRDLLWQLGLVNWLAERKSNEIWFTVYLTAGILSSRDGSSVEISSSKLAFESGNEEFLAESREVQEEVFNRVVWEEYMKSTNAVQLRPVFYSDLRSATCRRLRISDFAFDSHISDLLDRGNPFNIVWSSGTIPYSKESARLLKTLPPRSPDGQYIVYLKIGKKSS